MSLTGDTNDRRSKRRGKYNNQRTYVHTETLNCVSSENTKRHNLGVAKGEYIQFDSKLEALTYISIKRVLGSIEDVSTAHSFPCSAFVVTHPKITLLEKVELTGGSPKKKKIIPGYSWNVNFLVGIMKKSCVVDFLFIESKGFQTESFKNRLRLFEHCMYHKYGNFTKDGLIFVSEKTVKNHCGFATLHLDGLEKYLYDRLYKNTRLSINVISESIYLQHGNSCSFLENVKKTLLNLALNAF